MKQPEAYVNFDVYESAINLCGLASAVLPNIAFIVQSVTGAGLAGNLDAVIPMLDAMELTLNFRSVTDSAARLTAPEKHQIDLRVAEQYLDSVKGTKEIQADKYVMVAMPKTTTPGQVAPASTANVSGTYSVYRYEAYKDGEELWCLDPVNGVLRFGGVDYWEPVRRALGK